MPQKFKNITEQAVRAVGTISEVSIFDPFNP
jgi:hypothetical protein